MEGRAELLRCALNEAFNRDPEKRNNAISFILNLQQTDPSFLLETSLELSTKLSGVECLRAILITKMVLIYLNSEDVEKAFAEELAPLVRRSAELLLAGLTDANLPIELKTVMANTLSANLQLQFDTFQDATCLLFIIQSLPSNDLMFGTVILDFVQETTCSPDLVMAIATAAYTRISESHDPNVVILMMQIIEVLFRFYWSDVLSMCPWQLSLLEQIFFMLRENPSVSALRLLKRFLKVTGGDVIRNSSEVETTFLEILCVLASHESRVILIEICSLSNAVLKHVYSNGDIPLAYDKFILRLFHVLSSVDDGVWDQSDWNPQVASLDAIVRYGQILCNPEQRFSQFHAEFHHLSRSQNYRERFLSVVMMSAASANLAGNGRYFCLYLKDILELSNDKTARVREQALLALIDGLRALSKHKLDENYLELSIQVFIGTRHLCGDVPEIANYMISLYAVLARVPGFPFLADLFTNIFVMVPKIAPRQFSDVCRLMRQSHISFLPSIEVLLEQIRVFFSSSNFETVNSLQHLLHVILQRFSAKVLAPYKQPVFEILVCLLQSNSVLIWVNAAVSFSLFATKFNQEIENYDNMCSEMVTKLLELVRSSKESVIRKVSFSALVHFEMSQTLQFEVDLLLFQSLCEIVSLENCLPMTTKVMALPAFTSTLSRPFPIEVVPILSQAILNVKPVIDEMVIFAEDDEIVTARILEFLAKAGDVVDSDAFVEVYGDILQGFIA